MVWNPYNLYESKQRKVFWKQVRKKIKQDLKSDSECYGAGYDLFLKDMIKVKKVWQEPLDIKTKLLNILSNVSDKDVAEIESECQLLQGTKRDKVETDKRVYIDRLNMILKLGTYTDQ